MFDLLGLVGFTTGLLIALCLWDTFVDWLYERAWSKREPEAHPGPSERTTGLE